jgi:cytidine deaminase
MDSRELYRMAAAAMEQAYAPYSHYRVGAALLAEDGRVFTGVNVENASFGGTICAERTACVKAVSEGARRFRMIAVTCDQGKASMCGICRQFLSEFGVDLLVITGEDEEHLTETKLSALLPEDFQLKK